MKVLIIHSTEKISGGEIISLEIIKALKNDYEFLTFLPKKPTENLLNYYFRDLNIIYPSRKKFFLIIHTLREILKKHNFKFIHVQGTRAAFWGRLAIIGLKRKPRFIYTLHGFHIIRKPLFLKIPLIFIERFLNRWTDVLVCVSEADKNLVLKYKTILPEKIKVIKNGIDVEKFRVDPEEIQKEKEKMDLENSFILSSIGRLHPPKDFSTILKALKLIISQIQNVKLLIVGDGPLRKSLEKETFYLGLNGYVKFLGFRKDIPVLMNLSDLIILSTKWEGLPLVPLEAGACKKPIIASDVTGANETIIDGETGFLFKPGSATDLAGKIIKLSQKKELRKKMGVAGHLYVSKNFSKEKMIKNYQDLYSSLL